MKVSGIQAAVIAGAVGGLVKVDSDGNEHEVDTEPTMSDETRMRMEEEASRKFRQVMGHSRSAAEQRRKIINRHRYDCNDLEGMDLADVAALKAAAEKRARRAAKK